jgi:hypothetical protein
VIEAYLPDRSRRVASYGELSLNIIRYPSTYQQNFEFGIAGYFGLFGLNKLKFSAS